MKEPKPEIPFFYDNVKTSNWLIYLCVFYSYRPLEYYCLLFISLILYFYKFIVLILIFFTISLIISSKILLKIKDHNHYSHY